MGRVFEVGVGRRKITPPAHVELAGLGYYLNRRAERVRDDLTVTALVIGDGERDVAIVAADLMYNDAEFTRKIRQQAAAQTSLQPEAICVNFSHTHSAPTAGLIIGAGERDWSYLDWAANQAAEATIEAWHSRRPAHISVGESELSGMTFNRTRENGPVDTRVSVLRADATDGSPLAVAVNFHSHCTAHMEVDMHAVGRDWPGEVVDALEAALPGANALYLQGTCGDVNFKPEYNGTAKRFEPGRALAQVALQALENCRPVEANGIGASNRLVGLPTRRWTREEVMSDREEGLYRLKTGDTSGWLNGVARVCVGYPERLPLRYGGSVEKAVAAVSRFAVEWTDQILPVLDSRPERLDTEIQAIRIGDVHLVANPSELFTGIGLKVRHESQKGPLFMLSYSNGSIGYLPDAYDIARGSYAAVQSPKFTSQFPFTSESSDVMVAAMIVLLMNPLASKSVEGGQVAL